MPGLDDLTIVTVHAAKGGVGKTTVALNLAVTFRYLMDKRVLLVDLDQQQSISVLTLVQEGSTKTDVASLMLGLAPGLRLSDAVTHPQNMPGLDVAIGDPDRLEDVVAAMTHNPERMNDLHDLLAQCERYDVVIIDTAPASDKLVRAALRASDVILTPTTPDHLDIISVVKTYGWVNALIDSGEVAGEYIGIVHAMYEPPERNTMQRDADAALAELEVKVSTSRIPRRREIAKIHETGAPHVYRHPDSYFAEAYMNLADEVMAARWSTRRTQAVAQ